MFVSVTIGKRLNGLLFVICVLLLRDCTCVCYIHDDMERGCKIRVYQCHPTVSLISNLLEWIQNSKPSWFHVLLLSILEGGMASHDRGSPPPENLSTCYSSKQKTPLLESPCFARRWVFSSKDCSNCTGQNSELRGYLFLGNNN